MRPGEAEYLTTTATVPVTEVRTVPGFGARLTILTFLTAVYYLAAKFGLTLAMVQSNATAVWPCTGISLAAVLLLGRWVWPAIFLGALLANLTTAGTGWVSFAIATGNTLEALVGGWLVQRFAGGLRVFEVPRQIIVYTGLTALFSTTISATIGVTSLAVAERVPWPLYTNVWLAWWVGDVISDFVVAPFIILWFTNPRVRWSPINMYEAALLCLLLIYVGQCVFGGWLPLGHTDYPLEFLCLPMLAWAAFRFGQREAATASLLLSAIALSGTLRGFGPFARSSPHESLILLQIYLGVCSVAALAMAAAVSERRRAEEALRDSEARTRAILDTTVDAIISIDEAGTILSFNPAAERMFGYAADEAVGRDIAILMPEPYAERHGSYLHHYLATGERKVIGIGREVQGRRKDGTVFHIELSVGEVRVGSRRIFTGMIRDITERRRAEEERARLAAIVESSSDAIVGADLDGTIRSWNKGAERLFGYSAGEVIGRTSEFLTPPEQIHEIADVLGKVAAGERVDNLETVRRTKDSRLVHLSIMISPVLDPAGRPVGVSAIAHDITGRKQAETRLQKLADDLARSNKDLEHFAYIASHDLQEPLRKIRSFTELLARRYQGRLDPDADTFIGYTVDGVRRLQQLIDDLLTYSRAGRGEMPMDPVHVGDLVQQVLRDLERPIRESGSRVDVGEMPVIHGSYTMLRQVFQNLISNAVKFRSTEPLHIRIWAERDADGWRFGISDNGIGIPPDAFDRVFLVFQRLHTRQEYPGTGIGLSVCKRIIERHGGKIWVVSAQDRGSIFFFTIPDHDAAPFAELESPTRSTAAPEGPAQDMLHQENAGDGP